MKRITTIYEYRYDFDRKTIRCTEYECIETDKLYRTADKRSFGTTYTTQISKDAVPIVEECYGGVGVISAEPLNNEQIKTLMVAPYRKTIEHCENRIMELKQKISAIKEAWSE